MRTQKAPLTPTQMTKVLWAASVYDSSEWKGKTYKTPQGEVGEAVSTVLMLRHTGMHISVLAEPDRWCLRTDESDGKRVIVWSRPKKSDVEGYTSIPIAKEITFDVDEYIAERKRRKKSRHTRQYYHALVKRIGALAGIPELSPMSFRHTIAVDLLERGAPEVLVMQILNCSRRTLATYGKYTQRHKQAFFERTGW